MAAALLCFSAVSCGDKEKTSVSAPAVTETTATKTTATEAETSTTAAEAPTEAETTAAAPEETTAEAVTETDDDRLPDAVRLFEAINSADMMQAGAGVEIDDEIAREFTIKVNDSTVSSVYFMVTDNRFKNLEEVKQFLNNSLCGELIEKYKSIYEGEMSSFKEYNGYLYFVHQEKSCGFEYTGAPEITESSEEAFTATVPVNSLGKSEIFTLKAVKQDDKWKASSLKISKN